MKTLITVYIIQRKKYQLQFQLTKKWPLENRFRFCHQLFTLGHSSRKYKNYPIKGRKLTPGKPVTALVSPQTHSIVNPISSFCNQCCLFQQVWNSAQIHFNLESIMHQSKNFDSRTRKISHSLAISQSVYGKCYQSFLLHTHIPDVY